MYDWAKRAEDRLTRAELMTEPVIRQTIRDYNKARNYLKSEIDTIYATYSGKAGINIGQVKQLMSRAESDEFRKSIEKRIINISDDKFKARLLARQDLKAYKSRITRLEALQEDIYIRMKELGSQEALRGSKHLNNVANETYNRTIYDLQRETGIGYSFGQLSDTQLEVLGKSRWSGLNYSDRVWGNTTLLSDKLSGTIVQGMTAGKSVNQMARDITNIFGEEARYNAIRLIRTETNFFANQVQLEAYKESEVSRYIYVATLDGRTSDICADLDGQSFDIKDAQEGVNYPPMHPNCRSTTIKDRQDLDKLERRAKDKDGNTIKIPANISYKEWKNTA